MQHYQCKKPTSKCEVHQSIGNVIYTLKTQQIDLDNEIFWKGVLQLFMFAIRCTMCTTLLLLLSQLVFSRDVILNINQEAICQLIKQCKQALIKKGNQKQN